MKTLVFIDQRENKIKSASLEALSTAAKFNSNTTEVAALIIGSDVSGQVGELAGYGCDTVYTVSDASLQNYNVMSYTDAFESAVKDFGAELIIGLATPMGRDIFPRLAARLEAGLLTDLTEMKVESDHIEGVKPMYAGKTLADVATKGCSVHMATLRPNCFASEKSGAGSATEKTISAPSSSEKLVTKEIKKGTSEKADLTEATFIISGGRAMGSADKFSILNDCADVIGATVGASRAAVDSGYASHSMQVGQTGKVVNPNLYIACGISGSIQHMAGMKTSKIVVAVNTDEDAPIFTIADYGIVGDLFEVVPAMTEKFKEIL